MTSIGEVNSGTSIVSFEVRDPGDDVVATGIADRVIHTTDQALDGVLSVIGKLAHSFSAAMEQTPAASAELEFSLEMSASGDLYIASGSATGVLRVALTFERPQATG
ncbi:CU044_2847 family protein [Streptomyces flaveus]|uniref:CU044_2847 family protein n=1 Tax=Streptomyces flaveus TaxID=66370 RepID=UPI003333FE3B